MPYKRKSKKVAKKVAKKVVKKRTSKKVQKGGKRKMNEYFKLMTQARKSDASTFQYKGNTYKQFTAKTGLKMYKKA